MATLQSMTVRLGVDTNPFARGLNRASERLRGFQRDADGRLRDMRGRFAREGEQSGHGFARGIADGIRSGLSGLASAASGLAKNPYVAAAGTAIAAGLGATIASALVISFAGVSVIKVSYMLLKEEPAVKKAAGKLKDTAVSVMRKAAKPMAQPLADAFGAVEKTVKDLKPQFEEMFQTVADSGILKNLTRGIDKFAKNVMPGFNDMLKNMKPTFEGLEEFMADVGEGLSAFFQEIGKAGPDTKVLLQDLGGLIKYLLFEAGRFIGFLAKLYAKIRPFIQKVIDGFKWLYDVLVGHSIIPDLVNAIVRWFVSLPGKILGKLGNFVLQAIAWFGRMKDRAVAKAREMVSGAVKWLRGLPGRASAAVSSLAAKLAGKASEAGRRMIGVIRSKVSEAVSAVRGLPGRAARALAGLGARLYSSGRSLIAGFIRGIRSKIGEVASAASSVVSRARDFFPFSPAKEGPFSGKGWTLYSGASLIDGFREGIAQQTPYLRRQMNDALGQVPNMRAEVSGVVRAGRTRQEPQRLVIDVTGADEGMKQLIRRIVKNDGRGDVQYAFGR